MKFTTLTLASAAVALLGGAAWAQQPAAPTPGSVTGDWNGAHAPSDDKQYTEKLKVPLGAPAATAEAPPAPAAEPASEPATVSATSTTEAAPTGAASSVSFTTMTVTNGPVPDTAENRAKYGQPLSRAGKRTAARGN
jgi:hypothetical protein